MLTVPSRRRTVLLVDDDDISLQALTLCLEGLSPSPWILQAKNGKEGIAQLAEHTVDLVITDLEMPFMDGFSFLARLANQRPRIPAVVVTAHGTEEAGARLRQQGIYRMVRKPFDFAAMQKLVAHQLEGQADTVRGFSLPAVLHLIEIERKSCTVRLTKNVLDSDLEGALYFQNGKLMDAASENHIGEEAVRELLGWLDPLIEIERPAQIAEAQIETSISEFLTELARSTQGQPTIELPEPAENKLKVGKHDLETRHAKLLEALRHLTGAVAAALFTWPDIALVSASANDDNEPLDDITRSAAEAFRIHLRLEGAYGASEHESLFWLGRRFLLLHAIGPDHCAVIAADPELTTAQILRQQLRSLLPPAPKA